MNELSAISRRVALWAMVAGGAWSQSAGPNRPARVSGAGGMPFARGEVLNYSVNWPSGLSLGEAQLKAGGGEPGWEFEFSLEAGVPGLEVRDRYHASTDAQLCSVRLDKESVHGPRKARETVTCDREKRVAVRQTLGGGKSEVSIPDCVKDGLTFLYFLRRELAGGRMPPSQTVIFGAPYEVTARYADSPQIEVSGMRQPADRILVSFRGPASSHTFEIYFGRDPARTPLLVRAPFALGTFALELVR